MFKRLHRLPKKYWRALNNDEQTTRSKYIRAKSIERYLGSNSNKELYDSLLESLADRQIGRIESVRFVTIHPCS